MFFVFNNNTNGTKNKKNLFVIDIWKKICISLIKKKRCVQRVMVAPFVF